ncbi:MAG: GntR family transcriptional regulator [Rhodobacteraceae bacterium]|nr:GntR family transcriptional regulator [Paracoccaceae bacterium]
MADRPESARDRFDRIHAELRDRICLLDYAPGTRLAEDALATEFGVSRTPLRRVLGRLEAEGLLQSVHGVGTFVTDVEMGALLQTYALRLELCGLIGQLEPVLPDAALWARFEASRARAEALAGNPDPRDFALLNIEFFMARLALSGNAPLREISERLYLQTARIWLKSVFAGQIDLAAEVEVFRREIKDVLDALHIGDLRAAALIQRAHLSMSFERLRAAGPV